MKILMIGNKESGKTTYMASAFGMMSDGVSGFYIQTNGSTQKWFRRLYREIGEGGYPDATDKRNSYQFELYHNQKKVLDFEWLDYNGGIITDSSIEKLSNDIETADGMMVFLDSDALLRKDVSTHRFRRILALISNKLENGDSPLFSVIIVLTKYDKIPRNVDITEVTASLQTFIDSASENDKLYIRVVPVSCSRKGFYNVDLPLLDILDSTLKISYILAVVEAQAYAEKAVEYASKTGLLDWGVSKLFGMKTNGELAAKCNSMARERYDLFKSLETPMEKLANYVGNYNIIYPNIAANSNKLKLSKNMKQPDFIEL